MRDHPPNLQECDLMSRFSRSCKITRLKIFRVHCKICDFFARLTNCRLYCDFSLFFLTFTKFALIAKSRKIDDLSRYWWLSQGPFADLKDRFSYPFIYFSPLITYPFMQAPVVQKTDSAIDRTNHYPVNNYYEHQLHYPVEIALPDG